MRYVLIQCILAAAVLSVGCQSQPLTHDPAEGHVYPGRSTALGAPQSPYRTSEPWYAARNDARRTVAAGVQTPTIQHSSTRTYDRTHSHGGKVHDHYYRTRVNVRYRSTAQ